MKYIPYSGDADQMPGGITPPRAEALAQQSLLYVDHDDMDRLRYGVNLRRRFRDTVANVVTTPDAVNALAELARNPLGYAGVITEHEMPDVSGLEFLSDLRDFNGLDHLVTILVSVHPTLTLARQAEKLGAAYVPKHKEARVFADTVHDRFTLHKTVRSRIHYPDTEDTLDIY